MAKKDKKVEDTTAASTDTTTTATTDAGAAPAEGGETKTRAPAANFLAVVSGRLPLIYVHAIRFDPTINAMANTDIAAKFGTTVGKVFDVKKGRNFSYVDQAFKPTTEDVAAAKEWAGKVGASNKHGLPAAGDATVMNGVIEQYEQRGLASAEEAAAFSAARTGSRKKSEPKAAGVEGTPPAASTTANADALLG